MSGYVVAMNLYLAVIAHGISVGVALAEARNRWPALRWLP